MKYANELLGTGASDFPVKNSCKLAQHAETMRKKILGKRVMTSTPFRFVLFFYHNINVKENNFPKRELNLSEQRLSTMTKISWHLLKTDPC